MGYRYLSTSRGDGNNFSAAIYAKAIICIDTYLPREGTETFNEFSIFTNNSSIDTYLPREWPKTGFQLCLQTAIVQLPIYLERGRKLHKNTILFIYFCIDTYLPREGPKTLFLNLLLKLYRVYRYLTTSRGAGNLIPIYCIFTFFLCVYLPIYLSRGRKRFTYCTTNKCYDSISTYLPREGPETFLEIRRQCSHPSYSYLSTSGGVGNVQVRQLKVLVQLMYSYLSTSRGAGNKNSALFVNATAVYPPISLERGRKQVALKVLVQSVIRIALYLPREGPETLLAIFAKILQLVQIPIYLERGRKRRAIIL